MSITPGENLDNNEELKSTYLVTVSGKERRIQKWRGHAYVVCSECSHRHEITNFQNINDNPGLQFRKTDESVAVLLSWAGVVIGGCSTSLGCLSFILLPLIYGLVTRNATVWVASCPNQDCTENILVAQYKRKLYQVSTTPRDDRDLGGENFQEGATSLHESNTKYPEYVKGRRYDEAIAELQKLTEGLLTPHPYLFYNIALCYEKKGSVEESLKYYNDCRARLEGAQNLQHIQNLPKDLRSIQRKIDMLQDTRSNEE